MNFTPGRSPRWAAQLPPASAGPGRASRVVRHGPVLWGLLLQFITAEILQPICPIEGNKTFLSRVSLLPCDGAAELRSGLLPEAPAAGRGGGDGVGLGAAARGEAERAAAHAGSQADSSSQEGAGAGVAPCAGADHGCGRQAKQRQHRASPNLTKGHFQVAAARWKCSATSCKTDLAPCGPEHLSSRGLSGSSPSLCLAQDPRSGPHSAHLLLHQGLWACGSPAPSGNGGDEKQSHWFRGADGISETPAPAQCRAR